MRGIRYLIPRNTRDALDANPAVQWFVSFLLLALGVFLIVKGLKGFSDKRITGKRGRVFEGSTA